MAKRVSYLGITETATSQEETRKYCLVALESQKHYLHVKSSNWCLQNSSFLFYVVIEVPFDLWLVDSIQ